LLGSSSDSSGNTDKRKIKVLYIAGTIRSGTTLLAQLFGEIPGFLNIAEGTYFLYRDHKAATLACSCGRLSAECDVWREIVTRIPPEASSLGSRLLRTRYFHRLWWNLRFRRRLPSYQPLTSAITRTFESLLARAGGSVIVDSSKNVSTGFLLCQIPEIEVHVVHLVRHSHGIVDSWCRPNRYYRPSTLGRGLAFWCVDNALCQLLRSRAASYSLLRYEDFVRRPRECLERIASGVAGRAVAADFISSVRARVGSQHWLAGNPRAQLNTDLLLQETDFRVPWPARLAASLVTFPLLWKFGYLWREAERSGSEQISLPSDAVPVIPSRAAEETPPKRSSAAAG
jgi:hypothetical protein